MSARTSLGADTSANTSLGAHTSVHIGAHTSLGAQASAHMSSQLSLGAHMGAHTSQHMILGAHTGAYTSAHKSLQAYTTAHTSAHTRAHICAFLPRGPTSLLTLLRLTRTPAIYHLSYNFLLLGFTAPLSFFLHPGLVYWDLTLPMFVPSATNIDHNTP